MKKTILEMVCAGAVLLMTGCAAIPILPSLLPGSGSPAVLLTSTQVTQSERNYRIIKTNAIGQSKGFKLFGLFSFKSASYSKAATKLYKDAGIAEGQPQALANIFHEMTSTYFILFSLPKVTIRADLIEFLEPVDDTGTPPATARPTNPQ